MFQIGQEVVCIDDSTFSNGRKSPIKKGITYIVINIRECPKCKLVGIDVGIRNGFDTRCHCGTSSNDAVWWISHKKFVPVDYAQNKEVTFEQIKKDIPVYSN